jgi:hypothetical protein
MRRFFFCAVMASIAMLLPSGAFGSDQETAQKIAESLRASGKLKDYSIGVKFEDGRAYLLGRVASDEQAEAAVEMAERLPYVTAVENRLEVKPSGKQDFDVEQANHTARRISRDEAVFGSSTQLEAPKPPRAAAVKQASVTENFEPQPVDSPALQPAPTSARTAGGVYAGMQGGGRPIPSGLSPSGQSQRVAYDQPHMPCYSWPSYASHPNYAAVTYPNQYSAAAWPYIGPFYPYPQVPLGWRRVTLEWKDGWWWLDFNDHCRTFRK